VTDSSANSSPQRLRMVAPLARRPAGVDLPVRTVEPDDLGDLAHLMLDAYTGTIDFSGEETLSDAERELEAYFGGTYGPPLLDCSFVAEDGRLPVCTSLICLFEDAPLLAFTFTEPSWQGKRLATNLIQLSMNALSARGYTSLRLFVTVGNDPAIHIYEKLGFQEIERR
jgi:GNAT superfamily N-acetyltransferase